MYTNILFFGPRVKNRMTTNDSEVIIASCQWIFESAREKQFVLVAFPFRQIGSQSVQPVCN